MVMVHVWMLSYLALFCFCKKGDGIIKYFNEILLNKDIHMHQMRVAKLAFELAKKLNLKESTCQNIYTAATIHDIGKMYIEPKILKKTSKLTEEEYQTIKKHVWYSANFAKTKGYSLEVIAFILHHHENVDGSGYPLGLKGDQISIGGKV